MARWFEVAGSSLLPPAVLTVATALTVERRTPRWLAISLVGFWAVSIAVVVLTVLAPELEPRVAPPHLSFPGIPGEVVGWAWIAFRVAIFGAAIAWVALAIRDVGPDRARRRQLQVTLLALLVGTLGGVLRIAPPFSDSDPWIGVSIVTLSVVLASYAVFAQGIFFAPEIAGRAFRLSALAGVGVTVYVGILLGLTASPGGFSRSTSRSSSAWHWWRPWPSSSRQRLGRGAGWAPATATRPTTGCFAPSAWAY